MFRTVSLTVMLTSVTLVAVGCSKDPEVAKREFVRSGDTYLADGKVDEAVIEYRNAVQQDPRYADARLKLAEAYGRQGQNREAFSEIVKAADLMPNDADVQVRAGGLLLLAGRFEDAKARADQALAAQPNMVDGLVLRANALAGLKQIDAAVAEAEKAVQSDPDQVTGYTGLGSMQLLKGDPAEAEKAFLKAAEVDPKSVHAKLGLANFYMSSGRLPEAEAQIKSALELSPQDMAANRSLSVLYLATNRAADAEAPLKVLAGSTGDGSGRIALAEYYISSGRVPDGVALLESVAASDTRSFQRAKLRLAGLRLRGGDAAGALKHVDDVLAKHPTSADGLAARAELLLRAAKHNEALATAQRAVSSDRQSIRAHMILGRAQAAANDLDNAMVSFRSALEISPRAAGAELELAKVYLRLSRPKEALPLAEAAVVKAPMIGEAHLVLARANLMIGDGTRASQAIRNAATLLPNSPAVLTEVGLLEMARGNRAGARAAFTKVLEADSGSFLALTNLATLDGQDGQRQAALTRLNDAIQKHPQRADLLTLAGNLARELGDTTAAEERLRQAITADSNHFNAYLALGQLYASQKRLDEALGQFDELAKRQPRNISAHTLGGLLLEVQGKSEDAMARYRRALEVDPKSAVAANNLAWLTAESGGNLDVALRYAQVAKSELPDEPAVTDTLGWVLHRKGLHDLAIEALSDAVQRGPRVPQYHYHLGAALAGAGDTVRARASLQRALALKLTDREAADAKKILDSLATP